MAQDEFGEAPVEIQGYDEGGLRGQAAVAAKEAMERERYEEDNFVRLTLSKKDKAKEKLRNKVRPASIFFSVSPSVFNKSSARLYFLR